MECAVWEKLECRWPFCRRPGLPSAPARCGRASKDPRESRENSSLERVAVCWNSEEMCEISAQQELLYIPVLDAHRQPQDQVHLGSFRQSSTSKIGCLKTGTAQICFHVEYLEQVLAVIRRP
mmetsp:Transcript_95442/g.227339  ORF Transcript_95442/g.227339 Transcript_95442/m.227339 type:complete len:122 (-) Transcript_95442:258-623(-)